MTPNIAVIRIESPHWRGFGLWIPLFLLWIPLILLSPIILLVLLGVCIGFRVSFLRTIRVCWDIVCSLPGTDVRVCADRSKVLVRVL